MTESSAWAIWSDYGPDPMAIIDWIRSNKIPTIRGNHDNAVALHVDCGCGYKYKHLSVATREYTWSQITEKEEEFLMSLPLSLDLTFDASEGPGDTRQPAVVLRLHIPGHPGG